LKKYFITGIGTGVGKTLVSAILVEALKADYWKPVQCGNLHFTDSDQVKEMVSNAQSFVHPETYRFKTASSPHYAAAVEHTTIEIDKFIFPETFNHLIIEGGGGLMVPLNDHLLVIDLIEHLDAELILVSQNYLGSINHTLLSIEAVQKRNIKVKGIIFNGKPVVSTEEFILKYTGIPILGYVPHLSVIDKSTITQHSKVFCSLAE